MSVAMTELARMAAKRLSGTRISIHDLGPEFEAAHENHEFCDELDGHVMQCVVCNWWTESSMVNDDFICEECQGKDEADR